MKCKYVLASLCGYLSMVTSATAYDGVLDICISFTTEKKNAEGGLSALRSKIMTSRGIFNKANQDSKVNMSVNLTGFNETGYNTSGKTAGQVLNDLKQNAFSNVHANRNVRGCDSLALIASIPGCGIAYKPGEYSVTKCLGQHTFAHEIGHNFGCGHGAGNGPGDVSYAEGHVFTGSNGTKYKTILVGNYDSSATMSYRFSNPNITYQGTAAGTSSANNVRRIREKMTTATKRRKINFLRNEKPWIILNRYSNLVLQNPGNSQSNGKKLTQWKYNSTDHMRWKTNSVGSGWLAIRNIGSNKAIDKTGVVQNGKDFHQWTYGSSNQNQHFKIDHADTGYVRIRTRIGNKVIHNHGRTKNNGARVTQWGWNGATHMEYELRALW